LTISKQFSKHYQVNTWTVHYSHSDCTRAQELAAAAQNTPAARDRAILAGETGAGLTRRTRNQTTAFNCTVRAEEQLVKLEQQLAITDRWTADSADYIHVTDFIKHRKYLRAVDNLERLVIQRIFELTKMNHSGTGTRVPYYISHIPHDTVLSCSLQASDADCEGTQNSI
jgi:hypothetical protein